MPGSLVYETDLGVAVQHLIERDDYLGKTRQMKIERGTSVLTIVLDRQVKLPGHATNVQQALWPIIKTTLPSVLGDIKKSVNNQKQDKKKDQEKAKVIIDKFAKEIEPKLVKACMDYFEDFGQAKSDYKLSLVKAGVLITVNAGGLVASIAVAAPRAGRAPEPSSLPRGWRERVPRSSSKSSP